MKNYTHSNLRNIALVAHASSGKTMLGECMLACSDNINRLGSVTEGTTASDYHKSEQERQFSIHTSLLHAEWLESRFNIIDTPGYLDFIAESRAALKVSDLAVVVVHATHGIEIGTSKVWDFAEEFGLAKVVVVNSIDAENAQYEPILEDLKTTFGGRFFPVNIPINPGPGYNEMLDIIHQPALTHRRPRPARRGIQPLRVHAPRAREKSNRPKPNQGRGVADQCASMSERDDLNLRWQRAKRTAVGITAKVDAAICTPCGVR
jgi:elongation factor G